MIFHISTSNWREHAGIYSYNRLLSVYGSAFDPTILIAPTDRTDVKRVHS